MLQSVLLLSSKVEPYSVQEMRTKKCREAAATLKSLEKELKTFPKLKSSTKVALSYMARYQFYVSSLCSLLLLTNAYANA